MVALVLAQFAVPALVYFAVAVALRRTVTADDFNWFAPNYAFMAGPHILIVLAAGVFTPLRHTMLSNLTVASVCLIGFATWLVSQVPARESGLAWVLYPPIAMASLALAFFARRLRATDAATPSEAEP